MKRTAYLVLLLSFIPLFLNAQNIAVTLKVSGQVNVTNLENQTSPLERGDSFQGGERIETLSDGMAVIVFLDDQSQLSIQKNTTLTIGAEVTATAISKQIDMQFGKLRAEVEEQRGEFLISTPVSVASVKGTDFWATSDPILGDIFLGVTGLIEVQNLISGGIIEVGGGQVGTSDLEGNTEVATYVLLVGELLSVSDTRLTMEPAQVGEGVQFNGQVLLSNRTTYAGPEPAVGSMTTISGTANDDGSVEAIQVVVEEVEEELEEVEDTGDTGEAGTQPGELRIRFTDPDGVTKELIIDYQ